MVAGAGADEQADTNDSQEQPAGQAEPGVDALGRDRP
jgi:hypothetical protein